MVVSYDAARGEPRGSRRKGEQRAPDDGLGDCIDCQLCVQVCPTGIDIRDGLQMECIGCAACIDACDSIMDKMGYDRGLVRYASERELAGGLTRVLRPRLIGYFLLLVSTIALFSWGVASRPLVTLDVERDRGMYRFTADGQIENSYLLKVRNKDSEARFFILDAVGLEHGEYQGPGSLALEPGEKAEIPVSVTYPPDYLSSANVNIQFEVSSMDGKGAPVTSRSTFLRPR
tara:strand:- start:766 stop:1458 length:693 start_codon:yes stop_codon:yes gene_type:complete